MSPATTLVGTNCPQASSTPLPAAELVHSPVAFIPETVPDAEKLLVWFQVLSPDAAAADAQVPSARPNPDAATSDANEVEV